MRALRRLLAAGTLLTIAVGVPLLLVAIAGRPFPSHVPNWSHIQVALRQGNIPGETVIKVLACLVWLCWLEVVWALVWELVAQLRHPSDPPAQHAIPLVPKSLHRGVGRVLAFVLAASITVASSPLPALAGRARTVAAGAPPPLPPAPITALAAPQPALNSTWVVAQGDTVWDIAETALGDGARSSEIMQLNEHLAPRRLLVGQHLRLPADAQIPDDRRPTNTASVDEPAPEPASTLIVDAPGYLPPLTVTVQRGDNLWNLSRARLDVADGPNAQPTGPEVLHYLDDVIASNAIPSGNPSLIRPGEQFRFPGVGTPPAPTSPPAPPPIGTPVLPPADRVDPTPVPSTTVPTSPSTTTLPPPSTEAMPVTPTTAPTVSPTTVPSTPTSITTAPTTAADALSRVRNDNVEVVGIAGAAVLASGLLLTYRRRRSAAARRGARALAARPSVRDQALLDQLVKAADVPLLRWANHAIATMATHFDPRRATGTPIVVELSESDGIELLWDTPQPTAPAPWMATDDGWTWTLPYDPDAAISPEPQAAPIAGLATIGTRDHATLMLNLEALGVIAVSGDDPTAAEDFIRSIALELGSSEELANACVATVGLPLEGDEHLWRIEQTGPARAAARLHEIQHGYRELIHTSRLSTAFQTRLGGDAADREVYVICLGSCDRQMLDGVRVEANSGVAVLVAGELAEAAAHIDLHADGMATLRPLGLTFTPASMPFTTASEIAVLLDEADPPTEADTCLEDASQDEATAVRADDDGQLAMILSDVRAALNPGEEPDYETDDGDLAPRVLIRVLGVPQIDGFPNVGRLELGIVTFIACNGGAATPDQIIDAVWSGKAIGRGTFLNRLTKTRNALPGVLLGRAVGDRDLLLAPGVMTDLRLLDHLVRRARAEASGRSIELLTQAIELVEGVPFDDAAYDWAHDRQYHFLACQLIEDATLLLVDLALEAVDVDLARTACRRGLIGLPLNEPIYCARMRVEAAADNSTGIRDAYRELVNGLAELDGGDAQYFPASGTQRTYEQLLGAVTKRIRTS